MESVKTKYRKQFFVNEIKRKIQKIKKTKKLGELLNALSLNSISFSSQLIEYDNVSVKDNLDYLIDKFIGITNILHMLENQQVINNIRKKQIHFESQIAINEETKFIFK